MDHLPLLISWCPLGAPSTDTPRTHFLQEVEAPTPLPHLTLVERPVVTSTHPVMLLDMRPEPDEAIATPCLRLQLALVRWVQ